MEKSDASVGTLNREAFHQRQAAPRQPFDGPLQIADAEAEVMDPGVAGHDMAEAFDDGPSVLYQLHRASPDLEESGPYTHRGVFPAIQTANAKPRFPIGNGPVQLFHHEADVVDGSEDLQREVPEFISALHRFPLGWHLLIPYFSNRRQGKTCPFANDFLMILLATSAWAL